MPCSSPAGSAGFRYSRRISSRSGSATPAPGRSAERRAAARGPTVVRRSECKPWQMDKVSTCRAWRLMQPGSDESTGGNKRAGCHALAPCPPEMLLSEVHATLLPGRPTQHACKEHRPAVGAGTALADAHRLNAPHGLAPGCRRAPYVRQTLIATPERVRTASADCCCAPSPCANRKCSRTAATSMPACGLTRAQRSQASIWAQ